MEARFLHGQLSKHLHKPIYLDSQNLRKLDTLITDGLLRSEGVVLILTRSVLTRPFCLLELWFAQRFGVPIVVVDVAMRGFSWAEAKRTLNDLDASLEKELGSRDFELLIRGTLEIILSERGEEGEPVPSLHEFGLAIAAALRIDERRALLSKAEEFTYDELIACATACCPAATVPRTPLASASR